MSRKRDTPHENKIGGINRTIGYVRLRGILHHQTTGDGRTIAKIWPRKRGAPTSPEQINQTANFAIVRHMAHDPLPLDNIAARGWSKGTPLLPTDFLTKAAYGTMWEVATITGQEYWSLRLVRASVAAALDTFTAQIGSILQRYSSGWNYLTAGAPGTVLTSNGPNQPLTWEAGASGAPPAYTMAWIYPTSSTSSSNAATKGAIFDVLADMTVRAIGANITTVIGAHYTLSLLEIATTGPTVIGVIGTATYIEPSKNYAHNILVDLGADFHLLAGHTYAVAVTRTDGTNTTNVGVNPATVTIAIPPAPVSVWQTIAAIATNVPPGVGAVFSNTFGAQYNIGFGYRWSYS